MQVAKREKKQTKKQQTKTGSIKKSKRENKVR